LFGNPARAPFTSAYGRSLLSSAGTLKWDSPHMGPNRGGGRQARRGGKAGGGPPPAGKAKAKEKATGASKAGGEAVQAVTLTRENQQMVQNLLQQLGPADGPGGGAPSTAADTKFADVDRKASTSCT